MTENVDRHFRRFVNSLSNKHPQSIELFFDVTFCYSTYSFQSKFPLLESVENISNHSTFCDFDAFCHAFSNDLPQTAEFLLDAL